MVLFFSEGHVEGLFVFVVVVGGYRSDTWLLPRCGWVEVSHVTRFARHRAAEKLSCAMVSLCS